jgi:hypothetical protein
MVAYGLWGPPAGRARVVSAGLRVTASVGARPGPLAAGEWPRDPLLQRAPEAP